MKKVTSFKNYVYEIMSGFFSGIELSDVHRSFKETLNEEFDEIYKKKFKLSFAEGREELFDDILTQYNELEEKPEVRWYGKDELKEVFEKSLKFQSKEEFESDEIDEIRQVFFIERAMGKALDLCHTTIEDMKPFVHIEPDSVYIVDIQKELERAKEELYWLDREINNRMEQLRVVSSRIGCGVMVDYNKVTDEEWDYIRQFNEFIGASQSAVLDALRHYKMEKEILVKQIRRLGEEPEQLKFESYDCDLPF